MALTVRRCGMCRRVRDDQGGGSGVAQWLDVLEYMKSYRVKPAEILLLDACCDECETFYRQLMTYGQSVHPPTLKLRRPTEALAKVGEATAARPS